MIRDTQNYHIVCHKTAPEISNIILKLCICLHKALFVFAVHMLRIPLIYVPGVCQHFYFTLYTLNTFIVYFRIFHNCVIFVTDKSLIRNMLRVVEFINDKVIKCCDDAFFKTSLQLLDFTLHVTLTSILLSHCRVDYLFLRLCFTNPCL